MRRVLLGLLLLTAPLTAKTVSVDLGPTNVEHGLSVPNDGDGTNEPTVIAGRPCRRTAGEKSNYLYLKADPNVFPPGDLTLYVTVDLYDDGPRAIDVQYDRAVPQPTIETKYTRGGSLPLLGLDRWVRRTVRLEHARMGQGQNFGADLRLAGRCAVARVELSDEAPAGWDPEHPVSAEDLARIHAAIGQGMELTFGNDADPGAAVIFRAFGVTSVESYVTWETVEGAGPEHWDWSHWDQQVAVLKAHGLKWVPFLIAGPAYATPAWFLNSPDSHPYVCLEHGEASKVQSLWNPALRPRIERFLQAFADRYRDQGVIESVLLGISGIYGESIYPAGPEGGWTAEKTGPYHNHLGWWAGDPLAVADFRAAMQRRYGDLGRLNTAWGCRFANWDAVTTFLPEKAPNAVARADEVRWYEQSMTDWARWWVATTRKHMPKTEIYLCTGGDGAPVLGADFTAQAKAIAPYGAGVRITNEGSDYAANFAITREVATATGLYGTFCGFEPASGVTSEGNVARIYNATASGARQLHSYTGNVLGGREAAERFRANAPELRARKVSPPRVAIYLPRAAWAQDASQVGVALGLARTLRELADLDLVNATSVADGVLKTCRLLILPTDAFLEPEARKAIDAWVEGGGILTQLERPGPANLLRTEARSVPAHWRLAVGADGDEPFLFGDWQGPESGGEFPTPGARKRWTGAKAGLFVPVVPGQTTTIEVEAYTPPFALEGASGDIRLDGMILARLKPGHGVYRREFPGDSLRNPLARLTFDITGWQPSVKTGAGDTRVLGIALTRVEATRGAGGEPVVNRGAAVTLDVDKVPVTKRGRGAVVTLPRDAGPGGPATYRGLLGELAQRLGGTSLLDDDAYDQVFATRTADGVLWLNMTGKPVEKPGVALAPFSIGLAR